ncbi:hypothetical protein [Mucilaginibacter antarcticus]|uniref:Dolichyl-phosphate-mannose-protein mannosyltransferase n=1 Tax=Mucilaginibacter antarcticus TaxID=1855725 RepID=A0ABW5XLB8_9SPHI
MKTAAYLKHIDTLIAAILGAIAVYMLTKYSGVGISPDSIMYASTATNMQAHGSLLTYNDTPLVFFPVFYPFFLAVVQFISGVDPFAAGSIINMALFASVILVSGYILERYLVKPRIYKWLILIAVVLSPALLQIYSLLWSETLFILEVMIFLLAYQRYNQRQSTGRLVVITIIAAIACITRYAGITLIGAGGLLLILDNRLIIRYKIKHLLVFGFGSVSLLIANLIVNSINTGLSTGKRLPSITSLTENLHYAGVMFCHWLGFKESLDHFAIIVAALLLLSLAGLLICKFVKSKICNSETIIIAFAFTYGMFMILLATFSRFERLDSRLLSPMFIPLLIGITAWVPDAIQHIQSKTIKYAVSGIGILLMLAFNSNILKTDLQRYDDEKDYGVPGYADDDWNKSPFAAFLRSNKNLLKTGVPVYTNADEAFYLFTGKPSKLLPHRYFKDDVAKFYATTHYYIIWFKAATNVELIEIKEIQKAHQLNKLHDFEDGAIYEYVHK